MKKTNYRCMIKIKEVIKDNQNTYNEIDIKGEGDLNYVKN